MIPPHERPIDIITFTQHRQFLNLSLSPAQRTLLKSMYGMALTDEERDIWYRCTQREDYPATPFVEVTVISGARGGKGSRIQTPAMLYEAILGGFEPNTGETLVVPIVAQDADASRIVFRLIKDTLARSPLLAQYVASVTKNILILHNGIEVRTYPCSSKAIHGYSICAAAMDELSRFRFEGAADSDAEIESAILRGTALYSHALLIKASTPTRRDGVLHSDYERAFGKPDAHTLVWQAPSILMNPAEVNADFIARQMQRDPLRARRLYLAEFSEDIGQFLDGALIDAAVQRGRREIAPTTGLRLTAAIDAAGHGDDAFTLAIVGTEGEGETKKVIQLLGRAWTKPRGGRLNLHATAAEAASVLKSYGLSKVYGDRFTAGWVLEALQQNGTELVYPHITRRERGKPDTQVYVDRSRAYLEAGPLFRTGSIQILDDPETIRELRNLELSGEKVNPGPMHDDRANALCLAACMAVQRGQVPKPAGGRVPGTGIGGAGGVRGGRSLTENLARIAQKRWNQVA